jgi:type IV pilus assembly protein PilV
MARLQYYGMHATQGARALTTAAQLAAELGTALERLPSGDGRVTGAPGATATTPPSPFGSLLWAGASPTATHLHTWNDASSIPGARLDATIEQDPDAPGQPLYRRRWTVWDVGVTATGAAAKVIAVSVVYRERGLGMPREVVRLVHSEVRGNFMANLGGL